MKYWHWIAVIGLLWCSGPQLRAQMPDYEWAVKMGGNLDDQAYSIAVDAAGNVYVTGVFYGTADFDPGPGMALLTASGNTDLFIAKYDPKGNYLWAKSAQGPAYDYSAAIAIDSDGNAYITGYYSMSMTTSLTFDAARGIILNSAGGKDIFLAKYAPDGHCLWARGMGGTGTQDMSWGLAIDPSGNCYITGAFDSPNADFDPEQGIALMATNDGNYDVFLAKYDRDGHYVWAKSMGGSGFAWALGVALDGNGNIILAGYFNSQAGADFDPGQGKALLYSIGGNDVFLARYDTGGNYLWAMNMGGVGEEYCHGIAADASGNIYLTGYFTNVANLDPKGKIPLLISSGGKHAYAAKYDPAGNCQWAGAIGGAGSTGMGVTVDRHGSVYVCGLFSSTADFDPGPGTTYLSPAGNSDIFMAKYDRDGHYIWAQSVGGPASETGHKIKINEEGNVYVTGFFAQTADFNPGTGTAMLTSAGSTDAFILKLNQKCNTVTLLNQQGCAPFLFNGTAYTQSGTYTDTFTSSRYCDSIVSLHLSITGEGSIRTIQGNYCGAVSLNGIRYSSSGTYTQNYTAANGCDSTIIYQLTINSSPEASITQKGGILSAPAADQYQWIHCPDHRIIPGANSRDYPVTEKGTYAVIVTLQECSDTSECVVAEEISTIGTLAGPTGIKLYPNPATQQVSLQTGKVLQNASIRLVNPVGQLLTALTGQKGSLFRISTAHYPAGIYFIELREAGLLYRGKLIKE